MTRRRMRPKTKNNKKPQGLNPCAWCAAQESSFKVASSAKKKGRVDTAARRTEEVLVSQARRNCLKRYSPPERRTQGRQIHILAARKDEQKTNNNRLKRFGQRTFFLAAGKTANKRRFTDSLAAGVKRRHLWQAWKASRGCNIPPIRQGFFLFFPPHTD